MHIPEVLALHRLGEKHGKLEASLYYIARLCLKQQQKPVQIVCSFLSSNYLLFLLLLCLLIHGLGSGVLVVEL